MKNNLRYTIGCCAMFMAISAAADDGLPAIRSIQPSGWQKRGELMMQGHNATGAVDQLQHLLSLTGENADPASLFLYAKALYMRGDAECVGELLEFARNNPASAEAPEARRLAADYYFFAGRYAEASNLYAEAPATGLGPDGRRRYTYRHAISLLKNGDWNEAALLFEKIKKSQDYSDAAQFYLSYIDYCNGDYEKALQGFDKVKGPSRQPVDPVAEVLPGRLDAQCYAAQIFYHRAEWEDASKIALETLHDPQTPAGMIPEMNRIAGESLLRMGKYSESLPYLEKYMDAPGLDHAPSARYAFAMALSHKGDSEHAISEARKVADGRDAVAQGACLLLGDLYSQTGDSSLAVKYYGRAYRMGFDDATTEKAINNYVALRSKGNSEPFADDAVLVEDFLTRFPQSRLRGQMSTFLAKVYFNQGDYERALEHLYISDSNDALLRQQSLFRLGAARLAEGNPHLAIRYLSEAATIKNADAATARQARLWKAEALYAAEEYADAADDYRVFNSEAKTTTPNRDRGMYGLGYALYRQNRFNEAASQFRKAIEITSDSRLREDASMRLADCLLYTGHNRESLNLYTRLIDAEAADADYATLRQASLQGLLGNANGKIATLDRLASRWPESEWLPTAMLEKAQTLVETGHSSDAVNAFQSLIEKWPSRPETRKGMLQLAITLANSGQTGRAAETYRTVISRWPSSEEAIAANEDLRTLSARNGSLQEYVSFINSVKGAPTVDADEIERLTFNAAEDALTETDSPIQLKKYLESYPDGRYAAAANFLLASYEEEQGNTEGALAMLDTLLADWPDSRYAPEALSLKASILEKSLSVPPENILAAYRELERRGGSDFMAEAYSGIMRYSNDPATVISYSRKLQSLGGNTPETIADARLREADALTESDRLAEAVEIYCALAEIPQSLAGSKACVTLGELYVKNGKNKEAISLMSDFTNSGTPHSYWLARGYITLADALYADGHKSAAVEYIESLHDNYPGSELDIADMINQRLKSWK